MSYSSELFAYFFILLRHSMQAEAAVDSITAAIAVFTAAASAAVQAINADFPSESPTSAYPVVCLRT